jgi:hypothetical protein
MKRIALVVLFILAALPQFGCSRLPITGPLPESLSADKVASLDDHSPLAISPDGRVVALSDSGLKLFHLPTRQELEVSERVPLKLAWSPFGYNLAAAYGEEGKSTIVIYDQHGIKSGEITVTGMVTDLVWLSENEILASSIVITRFTFGTNFKSLLHRWQPGGAAAATTPLKDTTLQPATSRTWLPLLMRGPMIDVSPTAPQILYVQPLDPPLFTPYYKLFVRDLASGREMEVDTLGIGTSGGRFTADGELVVYGDGANKTTIKDPWTGETVTTLATAGRDLQVSPAGDYLFADGTLFHDGKPVTPLAPGGTARFTPDGTGLLVAADGSLHLLSGLKPDTSRLIPPTQLKKLLPPRSWRLDGLISPREYKESMERIKQQ